MTGKVAEIKKDLFGRYFVGLGTAHEGEMFDVMCYLDPSAEADAGNVAPTAAMSDGQAMGSTDADADVNGQVRTS